MITSLHSSKNVFWRQKPHLSTNEPRNTSRQQWERHRSTWWKQGNRRPLVTLETKAWDNANVIRCQNDSGKPFTWHVHMDPSTAIKTWAKSLSALPSTNDNHHPPRGPGSMWVVTFWRIPSLHTNRSRVRCFALSVGVYACVWMGRLQWEGEEGGSVHIGV